jgi:hypothetical protein
MAKAHKFVVPVGLVALAEAPDSPAVGDTYFDTTLKLVRTWDGTQWVSGVADHGELTGLEGDDHLQYPIMFAQPDEPPAPAPDPQRTGLWWDTDAEPEGGEGGAAALPDGGSSRVFLIWDSVAKEWIPGPTSIVESFGEFRVYQEMAMKPDSTTSAIVQKRKIRLTVDEGPAYPYLEITPEGTSTNGPLFIGGVLTVGNGWRDVPSNPSNGSMWIQNSKVHVRSGGVTIPIEPGASVLDGLTDVTAPADTPAGKVLGTTAEGQWEPMDVPNEGLPPAQPPLVYTKSTSWGVAGRFAPGSWTVDSSYKMAWVASVDKNGTDGESYFSSLKAGDSFVFIRSGGTDLETYTIKSINPNSMGWDIDLGVDLVIGGWPAGEVQVFTGGTDGSVLTMVDGEPTWRIPGGNRPDPSEWLTRLYSSLRGTDDTSNPPAAPATWEAGGRYFVGDIVWHEPSKALWQCTFNRPTLEPPSYPGDENAHWTPITLIQRSGNAYALRLLPRIDLGNALAQEGKVLSLDMYGRPQWTEPASNVVIAATRPTDPAPGTIWVPAG